MSFNNQPINAWRHFKRVHNNILTLVNNKGMSSKFQVEKANEFEGCRTWRFKDNWGCIVETYLFKQLNNQSV